MRTRALSGAETIHINGEVLEYLIQGNQHGYCAVHTPQCRTYGTMPYAVCRMKYAVREHASSLMKTIRNRMEPPVNRRLGFKAAPYPVLLCGSEIWTIKKNDPKEASSL